MKKFEHDPTDPPISPELKSAIERLIATAETAAYHYATASAVALPLRAAIAEMKHALSEVEGAALKEEKEAVNE